MSAQRHLRQNQSYKLRRKQLPSAYWILFDIFEWLSKTTLAEEREDLSNFKIRLKTFLFDKAYS